MDARVTALAAAAEDCARRGEGEGPTSVLQGSGRLGARAAKRTVERAGLSREAPAVSEALQQGEITAEHADVLARQSARVSGAVRRELLSEAPTLLQRAASQTPEQFEATVADRLRRIEADGGQSRADHQRRCASVRK
jgi:hypothetical protein